MRNKLFLLLPMLALLLASNGMKQKPNTHKLDAKKIEPQSITKEQLDYYLQNCSHTVIYQRQGTSGLYIYRRYDLNSTRRTGDKYFLNNKINHNAKLGNTIITLDTIRFIGLSYTKGFGFSLEAGAPGAYGSYSTDLGFTSSNEYITTETRKYVLYGEKDPNYNTSGDYYLYYRESFIDSIIVKMTKNGEFVSAEYYSSSPEDTFSMEIIKTRPTTNSSVLPSC